jgi:transposase
VTSGHDQEPRQGCWWWRRSGRSVGPISFRVSRSKEIVRELHVSRNTVRKVLRSGATAFTYEREVQPLQRLGPWKVDLERILAANSARPASERLALMRVYEELRGLGYQGGYDAVRRYARCWHREQAATSAAAFVPLSFTPGEAYQFDWSHEVVRIDGRR